MATTRRTTLLGLAALAPAALAALPAEAKTASVEAKKIYPFYDLYLGIPAAQRTLFSMGYFLTENGRPPRNVTMTLLSGGARIPIPIGADGRLQRMPTLAELKSKAQVEISAPDGTKFALQMALLAKVTPAKEIPVGPVTAAIDQCVNAIKSKAGVLGFAAPKIKRACFVDAGSGVAVDAQGNAKPLPTGKQGPAFDPEQMPGTVTIRLTRAPSKITLEERPKK